MAKYYAISDVHGCLDVFTQALSVIDWSEPDNRLFLLGDYLPHYDTCEESSAFFERCTTALAAVKEVVDAHPGQVVALRGNHDDSMLDYIDSGLWDISKEWMRFVKKMPLFHETPWQIFVHAGVEEDAGEEWKWATSDDWFVWKYPATTGRFIKDIVAGHVGVHELAQDYDYHQVYWDGESHYFLDGATEWSGEMPVLAFDTETQAYTTWLATKDGAEFLGAPKNALAVK